MIHDMPFVNDEDVIGKWEYYDTIQSEEQFDVNRKKAEIKDEGFKEIYFLPNGEKYWIFDGWTKGFLFTHFGGDEPVERHKYTIKKTGNEIYMFLEVNDSELYILKKTSCKKYVLNEIGRRDNIDLPFITDENIIGFWKSVDVVENIRDFIVNQPKINVLWLKSVCFHEDGTAVRTYDGEEWSAFWTKGTLIDTVKITASAYEIKLINGKEYLFLEWKMGNYVYGGHRPIYYVFERGERTATRV